MSRSNPPNTKTAGGTAAKAPARRWMSQGQVAEYLGVTDRTVRSLVSKGELPAYRLGTKLMRIDLADVDALLRRVPTTGGGAA